MAWNSERGLCLGYISDRGFKLCVSETGALLAVYFGEGLYLVWISTRVHYLECIYESGEYLACISERGLYLSHISDWGFTFSVSQTGSNLPYISERCITSRVSRPKEYNWRVSRREGNF